MIQPERQPTRLALGEIDPVQPIDPTSSLAEGLGGFWLPLPRLTGGSRLHDLSGHARHGDLVSMTPSAWGSYAGRPFPALDFSQNTGHVDTGPSFVTGEITVAVWIRPEDPFGSTFGRQDIFSGGFSGATTWELKIGQNDRTAGSEKDIEFASFDGSLHGAAADGALMTAGEWIHILGTYTGSDWKIYVNGQNKTSFTTKVGTGAVGRDTNRFLGAIEVNGSPDSYYSGVIGEAQLWNRGLSASEARSFFEESCRGFPDLLRRRDESALYVSGTSVVTVSLGTATAQAPAFDPTVSATANTIAPDTGEAAATGFAPSITATQNTVSLGTAQAATTGFEPTITADTNTISAATGQAQAQGFDPTISEGAAGDTLLADLGTAQAQGFAPSISTNPSTVTLGLGQASAEGFAPDVVADPSEINTGQGQAAATGFDPTVTTNARTVAPQLGTAQADGFEPAVVDGTVGVATTMEIEARPLYEIDVEAKPLYRIRLFVKERLP